MGRVPLLALAAPIVLCTILLVALAVADARGRTWFPDASPRNSAEAAAMADPATMLVFLARGENPSRDYPVRPHIISSAIGRATPLEAALWARSINMLHLLDRIGAIVDEDQRRHLACLAADLDLPEVHAYLSRGYPCVRGDAFNRIVARSRAATGEAR